ncbi:response regulator [Fervidobacterium islandicum]|uniref:Response regulator n=1 Tax=Fervidobacterium islandicum TaxID=2423 RepID=A0AAI8GD41_FERIS|nr:response regulator [Fervidobacterium islandicum]AMW32963.1 response regulator [Fervidobacterium islandicum]
MKKVLIVDDSAVWRTYLQNLLELHGHTTEVAKDGLEGLNKFFTFLPDVVILDYVMPKLNGVHFTRFIRSFSTFRNVGIMILTGAEETINPFWAKKSGANVFLKKTAAQSEIERTVLEFVSQPFSMEWSRELHTLHIEPYGELVDILEESLRDSTITKEILQLSEYIYDETLIMKKIYSLFTELLEFDNFYACISTYSHARIYAFGKTDLASPYSVLEKAENYGFFSYFEYVEKCYNFADRNLGQAVVELMSKKDEPIGFVLIENPKIPEVAGHILALANYSISQLFDLLNYNKLLGSGKELDEVTGAYNRHSIAAKITNLMDFSKRSELPLLFVRITLRSLRKLYISKGAEYTNRLLKSFVTLLEESLSDTVARVSIGEFLVVLLGKNQQQAQAQIDSLLKLCSEPGRCEDLKELVIETYILEWKDESIGEIFERLSSKK